jgi:hypothetical protein
MVGFDRRGNEPSVFTSDWDFFMSTAPISLSKWYLGFVINPNKWSFWIPLCVRGRIFISRVFSVVSKNGCVGYSTSVAWKQHIRRLNGYFNCLWRSFCMSQETEQSIYIKLLKAEHCFKFLNAISLIILEYFCLKYNRQTDRERVC